MKRTRRNGGFTFVEISTAVVLLVLVGTSSAAALRMSLRTLNGSELSAMASSAVREFREFSFGFTLEEIDDLNGLVLAPPIMGNGDPLPGSDNMSVTITVTPVKDTDPNEVVDWDESQTRQIRAVVSAYQRMILDVKWVITEE